MYFSICQFLRMLLSRCAQWFKDLWDAEVKWMQELPELPSFGVKVDRSKWHWDLAYFTYSETCFNTLLQQSQQLQLSQGSLPIHFRAMKRLDVSAFRMASASPMQTGSSSRLTSQILAQTKTENIWAENWTQARAWPCHLRSQDMNELQQRQCTGQFHDFQLATFLKQIKHIKADSICHFDLCFLLRRMLWLPRWSMV